MVQLFLCQWREERYPFNCCSRYSAYLSTVYLQGAGPQKHLLARQEAKDGLRPEAASIDEAATGVK
jgi:hypothetical protein